MNKAFLWEGSSCSFFVQTWLSYLHLEFICILMEALIEAQFSQKGFAMTSDVTPNQQIQQLMVLKRIHQGDIIILLLILIILFKNAN